MLEVKNIKIEYYGEEIATLNFAFQKGVTLLLGEVGSFKTTLFRTLGGIKEIPDGEIVLDGVNIEELPPSKRDMAIVSCDTAPGSGTVKKALMQPLRIRGMSKKEAIAIAGEAASKYGLQFSDKVNRFDGQNLISLFRARLSLRPLSVIMFEEPYHYMGVENADNITKMIKEQSGYVLVSSCDGGDVERLKPDYLVVLKGDRILQQGLTQDVLASPIDKYVAMFLGQ